MPSWSARDVHALARDISEALPSRQIDWDSDAGEEWARVVMDDEVECLIRAPTSAGRAHRFAFLRSGTLAADDLRSLLSGRDVLVVELVDFDDASLSANRNDLQTFIGSVLPPDHVFNPQRFSANDLWFVGV